VQKHADCKGDKRANPHKARTKTKAEAVVTFSFTSKV